MSWSPLSRGASTGELVDALNRQMAELDLGSSAAIKIQEKLEAIAKSNASVLDAVTSGPITLSTTRIRNSDYVVTPKDELLFVSNQSGGDIKIYLEPVTKGSNGRVLIVYPWLCDETNTITMEAYGQDLIDEEQTLSLSLPLKPLVLMNYAVLDPSRWVPLLQP